VSAMNSSMDVISEMRVTGNIRFPGQSRAGWQFARWSAEDPA